MSNMILAAAFATAVLALPVVARADSGHGEAPQQNEAKARHGDRHEGHGAAVAAPESLSGAWTALMEARDAIANDIETGALGEVHAKAEPLPKLVDALLAQSGDLPADKRARVEGAAKQVMRVADALHVAADRGDAARSEKELGRLDSVLELIRAQYPKGALVAEPRGHGSHPAPRLDHGAHAHADRPAGVVDTPAQSTVRIRALDPFRFEPSRIEVRAGVPTRIELENVGVAEHSFVVKTADGERDWVHLHAVPGATEAATYQLDEPGTYSVVCSIPGHTEGGMTGELVVLAADDAPAHSQH